MPERTQPTRGEQLRAAIIILELTVLLVALVLRNAQALPPAPADWQPPPPQDVPLEVLPADAVRDYAVYALDGQLYLVEKTLNLHTRLLPLREHLLWSAAENVLLTQQTLSAWRSEPAADWLPAGAELVNSFTSTRPVSVRRLDGYHVLLRCAGEDIVLLTY
ncbi:MAG: hypothetical protein MUE40_11535 [Anaerolineae bacterium]|jgi:hypothetical protein|nr:hypothetical protein [Anaerolineae bacterium]